MNIRVVKVDEYQFLTCVKHGLWAANKNILKNWSVNDHLVFYVDNKLAALSTISNISFSSDYVIWDVGLFPYRIPITFNHISLPINRIDSRINPNVKGIFIESWGLNYGWGINCQYPLKELSAIELKALIATMPNDIEHYLNSIDNIIAKVKIERQVDSGEKFKTPIVKI